MKYPEKITKAFLNQNPKCIFVFGDNIVGFGKGGAAVLRDHPQAYGFVTKKYPNNNDGSFYKPDEYENKFASELRRLIKQIELNPDKIFLISKLGGGLGNRYNIWEKIIKPGLEVLKMYKNVVLLYEE